MIFVESMLLYYTIMEALMSQIQVGRITIFEAMENIKSGKYVMPAFQRQFVWGMEQIEKLWDSILLDYPIANFLYWRIDDKKCFVGHLLL